MKLMKSLILGSTAGLIAISGAQAADLPVKAKAVEYVKVCSLYGAGFWYIPGTDTCIRIGGAIRIDTSLNAGVYDAGFFQGGAGGDMAYNRNYYTTRSRFNLTEDTRTATEYGLVRTFANIQMDFTGGGVASSSGIAGGGIAEVDFAFIQFAGFTFGKAVSEFDPTWALSKPTISTGFNAGSNDSTGINQIAYTATFGNGVSATVSLEDGQPYRDAGVVNTSQPFIAPFGETTLPAGTIGANSFPGNAETGDHVPDVVGNLRLDQAWGTLHFAAAEHEVHGTYYNETSATGHPNDAIGYALSAAVELKNLPTGVGDNFKAEASFGHGAAKYVWGGTVDTAGAGRFAAASGTNGGTMAFGYVLDGVYSGLGTAASPGTAITLSNAWEVSAFYEHYWNPAVRTSVFGNYSSISYGAGSAALMANLGSALPLTGHIAGAGGVGAATGNMNFSMAEIGTKTAWTPVKDLTFSAEFIYSRLIQNLNGTFVANAASLPGVAAGTVYTLGNQNVYNGSVQVLRSF